jgi:peptide/nickel transport system substrate-binding protein
MDTDRMRSMWWRVAGVALALVVVVALSVGLASAFAGDTSPSPQGKVVLRLGWTSDPDSLNPFTGYSISSYEIWALNYDKLGYNDAATLKDVPGLAESWSVSPDGKTWTFHIRKGVKWQDGQPLTARDVVFTYNYIIDNKMATYAMHVATIDKVVATDDYTVEIHCSKPTTNMLGTYIYILPEHIWSKVSGKAAATTYQNNPPIVGTGPFQTVERKKDGFVRMVANKDYWRGAPKIDEVIFETYQNADTMVQDFKAGRLDAVSSPPESQLKSLNATSGIRAMSYNTKGFDELAFNCYTGAKSKGAKALTDPAFRRALNWAIDKQRINDFAYNGLANLGTSVIQSDYYHDPDWHWEPPADVKYGFDLEKCKQLLDAAGYKDVNGDGLREDKAGKPMTLRLWARSDSMESQTAGKLIAGWFKQVGLKINFQVMESGAMSDAIYNFQGPDYAPDFDMFLWGWGGGIDPNFILSVFTSDQAGSWSDCGYSNPEYDRLDAQQASTIDKAQRKQLLDHMQQILYEDSPYIVLVYSHNIEAYNTSRWDGWVQSPKGGGVWYTADNIDSYLQLHPKTAATDDGSSSTAWIATIVVILVVVVLVIVLLVRRARGKVVETE